MNFHKNKIFRITTLMISSIVFALVLIISLFFYLKKHYRVFHIPTGSMESTLFVGDRILVKMGETVKRNAIVVVHDRKTPNSFFVKRIVGLPGETIEIKGDKVLVDSNLQPIKSTMHNRYKVEGSINDINAMLRFLHITKLDSSYRKADQSVVLTQLQKQQVQRNFSKLKLSASHEPNSPLLYPKENPYNWSRSHYGPLLIPKKDKSITLNKSFLVYKHLLDYEKAKYAFRNNELWINSVKTTIYRFKNNYCFLLGDNRPFSFDSRFMGFVPTNSIDGEVVRILWSVDPITKSIRWDRVWMKAE